MDPRPTISENDVHVLVTSRILTMLFAYVSASYRKADESLCFRGMRIPRQEVGFPPLAVRRLFVYLFVVCLSVYLSVSRIWVGGWYIGSGIWRVL